MGIYFTILEPPTESQEEAEVVEHELTTVENYREDRHSNNTEKVGDDHSTQRETSEHERVAESS